MASRIFRLFCSFHSLSKGAIHSRYSTTMGSVLSCGKKGSVNISGSPTEKDSRSMSSHGENEVVEGIVCSEDDIPDEGVKSFDLNGNKILLAKTEGSIYAVGAKCTHYGLPLEKGSMCNGRIRCPFHGACFNVKTGDIEDFPGLDSIPKFNVDIVDGKVKVTANKGMLESKTRVKPMVARDPDNEETFVVVGGGAAGAKCVETLRQEGFSGRIVLVTAEDALPYDRPKLSKAMTQSPEGLALRTTQFYQENDIELYLGLTVTNLDTEAKEITTSSGDTIAYQKIFLCTGGQPRRFTGEGGDLEGVFVLRSPGDANEIAEKAKGKKVVVLGTSFIGMEVAAYLATDDRCESVTVVGTSSVPFERSLGASVGERVQKLFEEKGVSFVNGTSVSKLEGSESVEKVVLSNDEELPAEVVVLGIGVTPSTEYLKDSGVNLDSRGYVPVDEEMQTNVDGVFCGGDIASFPLFMHPDSPVTIGHWQMAHKHGHVAAQNMVGKKQAIRSVPFFWTVLFGKSLRYTGYGAFDDVVIAGDLESLEFVAYYCSEDKVVGVASLGKDPAAANYANYLYEGRFLTKEQVQEDGDIVMNLPLQDD